MKVIEYPAIIYQNRRNGGYIANCIIKNLVGFGKTELDAIDNLKMSILQTSTEPYLIQIKPMYDLSIAKSY
jgi:predicted RNase H-like HicB family nuclease